VLVIENKIKDYDITIIGGGVAGLFAAYAIREEDKNSSICILDKGKALKDRRCPAAEHKEKCIKCKRCDITNGLAGAGAFSDAKFNIGTSYGGTLAEELGEWEANTYIKEVDKILEAFAQDDYPNIYNGSYKWEKKCLENNLQLLNMDVRHLGTDRNHIIMDRLIKHLEYHNVDIYPDTECRGIYSLKEFTKQEGYTIQINKGKFDSTFKSKIIIVATGRGGADFVKNICQEFNIKTTNNAVDIGVRVEMKDMVWADISKDIYEPKIICKTKTFEDKCRMFCFNQGGIVSAENNNGIITANGHSYANPDKKTDNCNFAILSSINFTQPFNQPTEYAENISKLANMIGAGGVIVQRFGDLVRGRRTTETRLAKNSVVPTMKATPGDISLVLPHRILTNIIETIYALDKVAPGTANDDTLLYGCESKYYSLKPKHDESFAIADNLYLIGDGSGIARGLSQSAAMGLCVGEWIVEKNKNDMEWFE
jgi:uncharacterized FAD-dependent dehydrogenase